MNASRGDTLRTEIGPFVLVPEWIIDAEISARAFVLYAVLGLYADRGTKAGYPAVRTLATRLRCSEASVIRARRELEEIGALTVRARQREDGSQTSNLYTLALVQPGGVTSDRGAGARATPLELEPEELDERDEASPHSLAVQGDYDPARLTKIDGRNLPWDALVRSTQADEVAEGGKLARAIKIIRPLAIRDIRRTDGELASPGAWEWRIAVEIENRAATYQQRWPTVELTPTALASNWSRVTTQEPSGTSMDSLQRTHDAVQRGIDAARGGTE